MKREKKEEALMEVETDLNKLKEEDLTEEEAEIVRLKEKMSNMETYIEFKLMMLNENRNAALYKSSFAFSYIQGSIDILTVISGILAGTYPLKELMSVLKENRVKKTKGVEPSFYV